MPNATFCFGRSHPAAPYWVMRTISPGAWPLTAKVNSSGSPAWHETDHGAFLRESDDTLCYAENGVVTPVLPRAEVKLRGLHNVENLLAAIAAVWGRVPVDVMRQVGSTFTGVEHRIEPVRVLDGVTYYNDSIASSPTRTIAGLRSFDQKIILIAAAMTKNPL